MAVTVLSAGYITDISFAGDPTIISPLSLKSITEGVVSSCSKFLSTVGWSSTSSTNAKHEYVVPRSIPM